MIRIREIDHLVLRVTDLERMLRFYCGVLGCTIERRLDAIGLVQLRAGRSLIDLVPVEGEGPSIYVADPEGNVVELKGPPGTQVDLRAAVPPGTREHR
jgi:catechol 2,3-dioxygenase-like lactoylglutathione lyase family enzyme